MLSIITLSLSLLSLLSLVSSQSTCDVNSAYTPEQLAAALSAVPAPSSSTSGSGSGNSCSIYPSCPYCTSDPTFELCRSWHQTQLSDALNANMLNGAASFGGGYRRSLGSRAFTLQCTDTEVCVAATPDSFWCIDAYTFDFQDSNGGSGNIDSNTYTMANGEVTVVASTATALPTPTGSGSKVSGGVAQAEAQATASGTSSGSRSSDTSGAARFERVGFFKVTLLVMGTAGLFL